MWKFFNPFFLFGVACAYIAKSLLAGDEWASRRMEPRTEKQYVIGEDGQ